MIDNILVPLDGSPLAEAALPYAKSIAARTGATLVLVRAAQNKSPLGDVTYDQQQHTIEKAEDYLQTVYEGLVAQGINVRVGVPYGGSAADWIVEESQVRQADLIIMATHDRIGPDRWLHGSVAEGVVNRARLPVMLVRAPEIRPNFGRLTAPGNAAVTSVQAFPNGFSPAFPGADQLAPRFESPQPVLIIPLDGSELAEAALPVGRHLAQLLGARLVLVGVVPKAGQLLAGQAGAIVSYAAAEQAELEAEARAYLETGAARVADGARGVETVLRYGDPATEIAAAAEEYAAAAVVMATHGRTGLVRSMLGSVAGGVLHRGASPVVLIRPTELRGAEEPLVSRAAASSPA